MIFLLLSLAVLALGAFAAFAAGRNVLACSIGGISTIIGCMLALYPTLLVLLGFSPELSFTYKEYPLPIGEIILTLDKLSALYLLPTLLVSALCASYGMSYLKNLGQKKHFGKHWFFFNFLIIGLILTFVAADAFLFMLSWEIMSLAPFFLINFFHEEDDVRLGAWYYLVAAHLGAFFLLAFFILLSSKNGGALDFASFVANSKGLPASGLMFIFALIGFGPKTGLMPVHIWLPEAHPAAPTHVSAVMSGVMINTGLYGIMRTLTFLGESAPWWAYTLMIVGAVTAVLGIFYAFTQNSIKRALAYSSVENMGLICMGLGFFLFSIQSERLPLALICLLGAMIHLINHSLYKSLLFLVAGTVSSNTGTDLLNRLGGLQKYLPVLGLCFFVGAAAICALPPLNGFGGKFILYLGFAYGGSLVPSTGAIYWAGLFVLALVSGFSLLCFTRLYGIAFLGNPRTALPENAKKSTKIEKVTLLTVAGLCFASALATPYIADVFADSLQVYMGNIEGIIYGNTETLTAASLSYKHSMQNFVDNLHTLLMRINFGFISFIALALIVYFWRRHLLKGREVSLSPTWDCGYANPSPRIQYTGGSFAQFGIYFTRFFTRPKAVVVNFASYFPGSARSEISTVDWIKTSLYTRLFMIFSRIAQWAKHLQHGRVNTYILYILITLVVLLVWKIR